MNRLSHTEWAAFPDDVRAGIALRLADSVEAVLGVELPRFIQDKATPPPVAVIKARVRAVAEQAAQRIGDPLPPHWVSLRLEHDPPKVDVVCPTYQHDCDACAFLGRFDGHDLYSCPKAPTLIARFGDEGPDFKGGAAPAVADAHLAEAAKRSKAGGR